MSAYTIVFLKLLVMFYLQCLADLKACKQTNIPIYSFKQHQRLDEKKYLYGAAIILGARPFVCFGAANLIANTTVEGIMTLNDPTLRALYDLKVCKGLEGIPSA
jgi:uridine kinase